MVKEIVRDEAFLAERSLTATKKDVQVGQDLLETLRANRAGCVGMAANMIGVRKRIIAVADGGTYLLMFNPEITAKEQPYFTEEGCLSLEGTRRCVRFRKIRVRWQTKEFRTVSGTFEGWTAEIIQHEIDHCNGIVI